MTKFGAETVLKIDPTGTENAQLKWPEMRMLGEKKRRTSPRKGGTLPYPPHLDYLCNFQKLLPHTNQVKISLKILIPEWPIRNNLTCPHNRNNWNLHVISKAGSQQK